MSTEKKIIIVPHDPKWKEIFNSEQEKIEKALGENCIKVHHIGSTAIPGLCAKPKIDIIAEVTDPTITIDSLKILGYEYRGEYNIPLKWGFSKRGEIDFNVQVFPKNHPEIELNLTFRDWLIKHPDDCETYNQCKEALLSDPKNHQKEDYLFPLYTLKKGNIIKAILAKAGYKRARILYPSTDEEWKEYQRIKQEQIFDPVNITYDPNHPSLSSDQDFHFMLYQGVTIVGIAHIQFFENKNGILRALALDAAYQNKGFGSTFLKMLEQWFVAKNKEILYLHARPRAFSFYQKNGYIPGNFNDNLINSKSIKMKKIITLL
jgi:GrpB-like predicted nucleotidyltransferase (UPF0157 family)/GNAT superfamily N-acetyltransferase